MNWLEKIKSSIGIGEYLGRKKVISNADYLRMTVDILNRFKDGNTKMGELGKNIINNGVVEVNSKHLDFMNQIVEKHNELIEEFKTILPPVMYIEYNSYISNFLNYYKNF